MYQSNRGLRNYAVHSDPIIAFWGQLNSLSTREYIRTNFLYDYEKIAKYKYKYKDNLQILRFPNNFLIYILKPNTRNLFPSKENDVLKISNNYINLITDKYNECNQKLIKFDNIYKNIILF